MTKLGTIPWVLVSLMLSLPAANAGSLSLTEAGGAFSVNIESLKEIRYRNVVKQQYDFSCGSAAVATLLSYHYEDPVSELETFTYMYASGDQEEIRSEGFSMLDMKRYLEARGYQADGFHATLDKLARVGIPAIALIEQQGYMHFVVIKGVSEDEVLTGDPAFGVKLIPRSEFEESWSSGVLTPKGRLVLEASMQYVHSSVNRVAIEGFTILPSIAIGVIEILEADRDTIIAALTGRYGVTNRSELEVRVPYVYRDDSTRQRAFLTATSEEEVFSADGHGIGDVEFGLRYQLNDAGKGWPFLVGNIRVTAPTGKAPFEVGTRTGLRGQTVFETELPTGTGFWSVNPGMTFIFPSDPVVFFGNVGYLWNLEANQGERFGRINPGDAFRFGFGMGLGANEKSSFSIGYQHDIFTETQRNGEALAGSDIDVGKLLVGYSYQLSRDVSANLSIAIGATEDAPDVDLTLRIPVGFDLF